MARAGTRGWWERALDLDGELYRHVHILDTDRATTADEAHEAAFTVVRSGHARGVLINVGRCSLTTQEVVSGYERPRGQTEPRRLSEERGVAVEG